MKIRMNAAHGCCGAVPVDTENQWAGGRGRHAVKAESSVLMLMSVGRESFSTEC